MPKTIGSSPGGFTRTNVLGGGGTAGSTSSGGSGGRASRIDPSISEDAFELVETGISAEVSRTVTAGQAILISWNKFAGAAGYRVFVYQKDGGGDRINEYYRDVGRSDLSLLWEHSDGAQLGSPETQSVYNVIPIVLAGRIPDASRAPGAYIKHVLKTFGGMVDAQLNLTSFTDFDASFNKTVKRYIGDQTTVGAIISEVEASTMAYFKQDEDGKLGLYLLDPTKEPAASFTDLDYVEPPISGHIQRSQTYNKVSVDFNRNAITSALETVPATSAEADYKYDNNQEFQVSSILRDRYENEAMAKTILASLKWQQPTLTIHVRSKGFVVTIGDVVSITKTRGFSKTGTYADDRWFCVGVTRNLQMATCRLLLIKIWQNTDKYKDVAPDSVPAWGSATAEQKEQYAFVHADTNLVGGTTFKQSVIGPR